MAAFDKLALQRFQTTLLPGGIKIYWLTFATNDLLSEVATAGYFNNARDSLSLNSLIFAVIDCDGTANYVTLRITGGMAVGSNITCAIDTPAS